MAWNLPLSQTDSKSAKGTRLVVSILVFLNYQCDNKIKDWREIYAPLYLYC